MLKKDFAESRRAKMEEKEAWLNKPYALVKDFEDFYVWHKTYAPNSWETDRYYVNYIVAYFVTKKGLTNPNHWVQEQYKFKTWLQEEALGSTKGGEKLSYSTINHIIKTYNNFMKFMFQHDNIMPEKRGKLETYPQRFVNRRGPEDVIRKDKHSQEYQRICKALKNYDPLTAKFFIVLYNTGMRVSECLGLPMGYIYSGNDHIDESGMGAITRETAKYYSKIYGYIVLESQLKEDFLARDEDEHILRKPLKGKDSIAPQHSRTIPIVDKETWEIIVDLYREQEILHEKNEYGTDKKDYALFDELNYSRANRALAEAYRQLGIRAKSFHCCRHSFITYLVGETANYFLSRAISGHKSDQFDTYNHIFALINLWIKQATSKIASEKSLKKIGNRDHKKTIVDRKRKVEEKRRKHYSKESV